VLVRLALDRGAIVIGNSRAPLRELSSFIRRRRANAQAPAD
jgi:hypothetical protein